MITALGNRGRPAQDAADWLNASMAAILGIGRNRLHLSGGEFSPERRRENVAMIANQIGRRFQRRVHPDTGMVSYDIIGPEIVLEGTGEATSDVARRAGPFIAAALERLADVDPHQCRTGLDAESVKASLDHARSLIVQIQAEIGGGPLIYVRTLFDELLDDPDGVMAQLRVTLDRDDDESHTVDDERQVAAVDAASEVLTCLREAVEDACAGRDGLEAALDEVGHCAGEISSTSRLTMEVLSDFGVTRCELDRIAIDGTLIDEPKPSGAPSVATALHMAEAEPQRWLRLAALGTRTQLKAIVRSASILNGKFKMAESGKAAERFRLGADETATITVHLQRLFGLVEGITRHLRPEPARPARPRRARTIDAPEDDLKPMTGGGSGHGRKK